jgi:hypothetical protein
MPLRDLSNTRAKDAFASRATNRMRQIQGTRMSSWAAIYISVSQPYDETPLLHLGGSKALIRERFTLLNEWHGGYYHYLRGGTFFEDNGFSIYPK